MAGSLNPYKNCITKTKVHLGFLVFSLSFSSQQQCCCQIQAAIAENNYNNAMNTAAINANTTAQTQRILDAITGNQIQDLRDQVGQLQLANQLQGVVRYPQGWTYNAGTNPFCANNGCGCNGFNM